MCTIITIIFKENYKAISINRNEKNIILFDKNKQVNIIPFNDIDHIDIITGAIVRGIVLGQISLLTKSGIIHRITISNINELYFEIEQDLNINIKDSILFFPKQMKKYNEDEKNNPITNYIQSIIVILLIIGALYANYYKFTHKILKNEKIYTQSVEKYNNNN